MIYRKHRGYHKWILWNIFHYIMFFKLLKSFRWYFLLTNIVKNLQKKYGECDICYKYMIKYNIITYGFIDKYVYECEKCIGYQRYWDYMYKYNTNDKNHLSILSKH